MRKARVLFVFLLLVAGALGFYGWQAGWLEPPREESSPKVARGSSSGNGGTQQPAQKPETDVRRPTFDIVRAESDGSMVMAGQSEPNATIIVQSNGEEVGRTKADTFGEWVMTPETKLAKGEHSLELIARSPDSGRTLFSKQRLALSLSEDAREGQPLVALTEEGKATRVLQMPPPRTESRPASAEPDIAPSVTADAAQRKDGVSAPKADADTVAEAAGMIGFASVDYEDAGQKSMLYMNGHARPDSRIALFVDGKRVGIVSADATGSWSFSGNRELPGGRHVLRADLLDEGEEKTLARAEVDFERIAPATALLDEGKKPAYPAQTASVSVNGPGNDDLPGVSQAGSDASAEPRKKVIVIRQGDTLWQIAQRHYGDGAKYTQIFRNNRNQIRDPNWIFPQQRLELPVE